MWQVKIIDKLDIGGIKFGGNGKVCVARYTCYICCVRSHHIYHPITDPHLISPLYTWNLREKKNPQRIGRVLLFINDGCQI